MLSEVSEIIRPLEAAKSRISQCKSHTLQPCTNICLGSQCLQGPNGNGQPQAAT